MKRVWKRLARDQRGMVGQTDHIVFAVLICAAILATFMAISKAIQGRAENSIPYEDEDKKAVNIIKVDPPVFDPNRINPEHENTISTGHSPAGHSPAPEHEQGY